MDIVFSRLRCESRRSLRANGAHLEDDRTGAKLFEKTAFDQDRLDCGRVRQHRHDHVCGAADIYFSGHDHDRQWLLPPSGCATEFVVSGAGSKLTADNARGNPVKFEDYTSEGFVWVEITGTEVRLAFYDKAGVMNYEGVTSF